MANVLKRDKQIMCLKMLCEGNSIRSTSRMTGVHKTTVGNLITRFGQSCAQLMDDMFRDLNLSHIQSDEIWTFCGKKQARLTLEERQTRHDIGDVFLWTCLDEETKLIPSFVVGKRSADNARRLMTDLASRVTLPNPHASDNHAWERRRHEALLRISTDGFAAYPEAVDLAFGPYVEYGVIIKEYRNASMRYDPSEMVGTQRRPMRGDINPQSICTSHVERHNLTIRTFMKRFTRLSLGFSKKLECLEAAIAMFLAYYNFVWRTRYPDRSGRSGQQRPTAAMMAEVTDRLWSFEDFYENAIVCC